jgi:hypothetical protein
MMETTPFFPPWRRWLGRGLAVPAARVRACTLSELEERFGGCVPDSLFPKAAHSRDRLYTRWRTFWCVLWQALHPAASGREVVRQLQALFALHDGPLPSERDGAYFRARGRLPLDPFAAALSATAGAADARAPATTLQGRTVRIVDGSTVTLSDTPKNRAAYPPVHSSPPNFPLMRLVVLFSLASGAVLALAQGSLLHAEAALFASLFPRLVRKDIVIGDRLFGSYVMVALLQGLGVDFVGRTTRRLDGRRRTRRLGKNDWLLLWEKPREASAWLPLAQWCGLPAQLPIRVVRGQVRVKGYRVRELTVVTTLLDAALYPPEQILRAYLRRWRLEMCLDDLKTTLGMETLRGRSPATLQQDAYARLIAHNLVRWTMACAAREHAVELERISFKGTLDALRHFSAAMSRARSGPRRRALWAQLLRTLAADLLPLRPGRREPRAVKRKKNKYRRLSRPRHLFRDYPKRHERRTRSRLRRLGLM